MGIAFNDRRIQIAAAAAQTVFDCDFPVAGAADLEVWRTRAGASALLAMPTDYTVSSLGLTSAGRVMLAAGALAGDVYTLSGRRAEVRATDFLTSGDFRADDIDAELDRIYVGLQELRRDVDRRPGPGVDSALTGLIDLPERAATAPPADIARVYAKDVAGETHLFVRTATTEINLSAGSRGPTGASGPVAIDYIWDTGTAAADPGPGKVRASVGTFAGSFSLYISETDRLGNNLAALLQSWDDSTSTIRGKLEIIDLGTPANRMYCAVTGTVSDGGVFDTISVTYLSGVTSFAAVNVGLLFFRSGDRGADGLGIGDVVAANNLSDLASKKTAYDNLSVRGADIASAATIDLDAATGNLVDVTGTTTVTAITLASGRERTVRFTGVLTLTNGASLVLPGGANITTAAGDYAVLRGYAAGVVRCVAYTKANGQAVVGGAGGGGHGQCRLALSGGNLKLSPFNGDKLVINGVTQSVPSAGVTLAATGLSVGTVYNVYAFMSGATMTLEASTSVHVTDTAAGNVGVEIKTGNPTHTLVGMARIVTGPAFADSATQRFVLSYFNRAEIVAINALSANFSTTSTTDVDVMPSNKAEFLSWSGLSSRCVVVTYVFNSASGAENTKASFDGASSGYSQAAFGSNGYPVTVVHEAVLAEGYHYATALGNVSSGTGTWGAANTFTNVHAYTQG